MWPLAGYAYLVGYGDTTTGRHAHARRFAVMIPASANALTLAPTDQIRPCVVPESTLAIVPGNAPSSITNRAFESRLGTSNS